MPKIIKIFTPYTWIFWGTVRRHDLLSHSGNPPIPGINQYLHPEIYFYTHPRTTACPTVLITEPLILSLWYVTDFTGSRIKVLPPLLISGISDISASYNQLSIARYYCSSLVVWSLDYTLRISRVLYFSYINYFVTFFDAVNVIENLSMVTLNSNSGQATTTFSNYTYKITLYDIYLLEWGN